MSGVESAAKKTPQADDSGDGGDGVVADTAPPTATGDMTSSGGSGGVWSAPPGSELVGMVSSEAPAPCVARLMQGLRSSMAFVDLPLPCKQASVYV